MDASNDNAKACCMFAHWDHVSDVDGGQLWVQDCPEHGHRVGSEFVLRYSRNDAPSPEAAVAH